LDGKVDMPAYSGGNRWVGISALISPPVPPPLHRIARVRIAARTHRQTHVDVDGQRISAAQAQDALSLLGRVLGNHGDFQRQAKCFALARSLYLGNARPGDWPGWVRNAVLAYAAEPELLRGARAFDLGAWRLWSSRRAEPSPKSRREAPRDAGRSAAANTGTGPIPLTRPTDIIKVTPPASLDPGPGLDDVPLDPDLASALVEVGWDCQNALRRRWLRLATVHVSYLHERREAVSINAELLKMLETLGSRWVGLYMLEEFAASEPLATASDQSRAWAEYLSPVADLLAGYLHVGQACLLGKGEESLSRDARQPTRTVRSVTMQIIGVICVLDGLSSVSEMTRTAYQHVTAAKTPAIDWLQVLAIRIRGSELAWTFQTSGPEHRLIFEATVRDRRGRKGRGSSNSKSGARMAAAHDFVSRHLPDAARDAARKERGHPAQFASAYAGISSEHSLTLNYLREIFELPRPADPLLAQALTHASWAHENRTLVDQARQRDYAALARLGAAVCDALVAYEQARGVVSRTLTPTEDEARIMAPTERRVSDLFEDFQLQVGLLLGGGEAAGTKRSIHAGSMQALMAVAWKYRRERLLIQRPRPMDEWLQTPNGLPDPSTSLQQLCSEFKINYSIDYTAQGPDHQRRYAAILRFKDGPGSITLQGPSATGKTEAKHLASAEVLRKLGPITADQNPRLHRFLLRMQIKGVDTADVHRSLLRGWLGASHLASADLAAFGAWAEDAERTLGPLGPNDLVRMRSFYERCLVVTRPGSLSLLRNMFTQTIEWLLELDSAAEALADSRWSSFRAVAATLAALSASSPGSIREVISEWYGVVGARIHVELASEPFGENEDNLVAAQATALRFVLHAAAAAVSDDGGLQLAVYSQEGSAQIAVTSSSDDLQRPLAELIRLLDESISHFACVQIDDGWLINADYASLATVTRLPDLAKALLVDSGRTDLLSLAKHTEHLADRIERGSATGTYSDCRAQANELYLRKTSI